MNQCLGNCKTTAFVVYTSEGPGRELDLERVLRKLRAAYRDSGEIPGQRDAILCSARASNLQFKSVMRGVPVLGDELQVRANGAHRRRNVRIGNPEVAVHADANDCVVGRYRYENHDVLVDFVGRLDRMETGRLAIDFRA